MITKAEPSLKIADLVWVATALLHRENPEARDFSKNEIRQRAAQEDPENASRPGVSLHISTHCVASKPASPAKHRMLTRTRRGRRRLYQDRDETHRDRAKGAAAPAREDLPDKYHPLIDWYETEYKHHGKIQESAASHRKGATPEKLMRLMGRISREDAEEMVQIIDDCCGQVDASEW
jgi:hypothetical protein